MAAHSLAMALNVVVEPLHGLKFVGFQCIGVPANCDLDMGILGWIVAGHRILLTGSSRRESEFNSNRKVSSISKFGLRRVLILIFLLCFSVYGVQAKTLAILACPAVGRASCAEVDSYVKLSVAQISHAESKRSRMEVAQRLNRWVASHQNEVSPDDIDAMAELLGNDDDGVRGWIAGALGFLGEKAYRAVPLLQKALKERPCSTQSAVSSDAIRLALTRIEVQLSGARCDE